MKNDAVNVLNLGLLGLAFLTGGILMHSLNAVQRQI
jgi:hypothetical protein